MSYKNIKLKNEFGYLDGQFSSNIATVNSLVINSGSRGNGFGSKLYELFENKAKDFGIDLICLDVFEYNDKGISFWEKMGFTIGNVDNQQYLECHKQIKSN